MAISGSERWLSVSRGRRVAVLIPLVIVLDLLVVLALGLMPLDSIAGLKCEAVLRGGEPKAGISLTPSIIAVQEERCSDAKSGRTMVMLGVGIAVLAVVGGAVLAPADRLERALVGGQEAEDAARWEEEARRLQFEREAEAREARVREEGAVATARREAQARQEEERLQAAAERRAARVAKAREARHRARADGAAAPARKGSKATAKTTKKVTKKVAKASKKVVKAPKKVVKAPKKVVKAPKKVVKAPKKVGTAAARPTKAATATSRAAKKTPPVVLAKVGDVPAAAPEPTKATKVRRARLVKVAATTEAPASVAEPDAAPPGY